MAALFGRHVNKIDRKGRISVPKPFRDALTEQQFAGIHVFPSFKYAAIEALSEAFFNRVVASLENLDLFSDDQDDLAAIVENTHALPYDTEGRVILPKPPYRACQSGIGGGVCGARRAFPHMGTGRL